MSATSNIPRCAWIIISIPTAILIFSLSCLVFTYAWIISSAKESTLTTPWLTIITKVNNLDDNLQDIQTRYNQILANNTQLIDQLSKIKTAPATQQGYSTTTLQIPVILDSIKRQSMLLMDQKQKLQGISDELQNVKQQLQPLIIKHDELK